MKITSTHFGYELWLVSRQLTVNNSPHYNLPKLIDRKCNLEKKKNLQT